MIIHRRDVTPLLLLADNNKLIHIEQLLLLSNYAPIVATSSNEVLQYLRGKECATVFIDCETAATIGLGVLSKFKVANPSCRIVMICSRDHKAHRDIIREAFERGIYSCLLIPFEDWEVLTMVQFYHL